MLVLQSLIYFSPRLFYRATAYWPIMSKGISQNLYFQVSDTTTNYWRNHGWIEKKESINAFDVVDLSPTIPDDWNVYDFSFHKSAKSGLYENSKIPHHLDFPDIYLRKPGIKYKLLQFFSRETTTSSMNMDIT